MAHRTPFFTYTPSIPRNDSRLSPVTQQDLAQVAEWTSAASAAKQAGNALFAAQDYKGAMIEYSKPIELLMDTFGKSKEWYRKSHVDDVDELYTLLGEASAHQLWNYLCNYCINLHVFMPILHAHWLIAAVLSELPAVPTALCSSHELMDPSGLRCSCLCILRS
jgi:hypothetical protein